jgi:pimeloyl-ACP methyl ester carboxylesterase
MFAIRAEKSTSAGLLARGRKAWMRMRTVVLTAVAAASIVATACTGASSSSASASPASAPLTFDKVDVGGYRLAYECVGEGTPTIIAEAGYNTGGTTAFTGVLQDLAATTRVCTYDRAGTGNSDDRPKTPGLTSEDQADELQTMLTAARIQPPYVLLAHSYGGFVGRLFAADHRDEVAGMILIESSHEDEIAPYRQYYGSPDGDWIDGGSLLDIAATGRALRMRARDFGAIPLLVIRAERYDDVLSPALWRRTQADLATLSSDSIEVEALGSGHFVMDDNPPVVVTAADAVVEAVRAGDGLASCAEIFGAVGARCLQG